MVKATKSPSQARRVLAFLVRLFTFFFVIATISTVISLFCVNDLLANAEHVNGLVVDIKYGTKGRRAPVVRFETTNGEILQLKSRLYTSPAPNVGDTVRVVYRTSNPQDWQIDDWIHLYFWTLIGSVFMFSWAMAIIITKLVGDNQIRKLERAGASPTTSGI